MRFPPGKSNRVIRKIVTELRKTQIPQQLSLGQATRTHFKVQGKVQGVNFNWRLASSADIDFLKLKYHEIPAEVLRDRDLKKYHSVNRD